MSRPTIHAGVHSGWRWPRHSGNSFHDERSGNRPRPQADQVVPPATALLIANEDFGNKEWLGASHGEMLPTPPLEPAPQPQTEFEIPAPPWADELTGDLDLSQLAPLDAPSDKPDALTQMRIDADDVPEPAPWAPPMVVQPMPRIEFEAPDWEAEAEERAERDREAAEREARERRAQLIQELLAEEEQP